MTDPKLRELLDACRPGSDDLDAAEMQPAREQLARDPRLAEGFARSQKLDARLARVFQEVPVPEGLADRLLDHLQSASTSPAEPTEADGGPAETAQGSGMPSVNLRRRRVLRWTVGTVAGVAAALFLAVLIRQLLPGTGEPRPDEAFRLVVQAWSEDAAAGPWQNDFRGEPLEAYPLDVAVRVLPSGWRRFATPYDSEGLVYNLSSRSTASALLFCFRCEVPQSELALVPPRSPFSTTGGIAIGMWRRGDLVYVLAVQGGTPQYRNLLNRPTEIGFRLSLPEKLS